jgi:hypothetical protein
VNVRVTPLTAIVSAEAELAQHNTAAAATHRNFVGIGFHPATFGDIDPTNGSGLCPNLFREQARTVRISAAVGSFFWRIETMKLAIALATVAGLALAIPAANADETRVGVGVGPVGAGVTVGESHERDRTTVIRREDEPREHTTVIKREREEPSEKVIIKRDRD